MAGAQNSLNGWQRILVSYVGAENIEVHHIRKLADLKVKGKSAPPVWVQIMAARQKKTLVVCRECHTAIHNGTLNVRS